MATVRINVSREMMILRIQIYLEVLSSGKDIALLLGNFNFLLS